MALSASRASVAPSVEGENLDTVSFGATTQRSRAETPLLPSSPVVLENPVGFFRLPMVPRFCVLPAMVS